MNNDGTDENTGLLIVVKFKIDVQKEVAKKIIATCNCSIVSYIENLDVFILKAHSKEIRDNTIKQLEQHHEVKYAEANDADYRTCN